MKKWVVYDERAADGDTDVAQVLEACSSEAEAIRCVHVGYVFVYDVVPSGVPGYPDGLVNESFVGPTRALSRRGAH